MKVNFKGMQVDFKGMQRILGSYLDDLDDIVEGASDINFCDLENVDELSESEKEELLKILIEMYSLLRGFTYLID